MQWSMKHSLLLAVAIAVAAPSASCVGSASVETRVDVTPRVVWVAPGVWVVEDYDRAVYYYDSFYWWHYDGFWYRSSYYNDGFVRISVAPPAPVVGVYRPRRHIRYHAPRGARARKIERKHYHPRPTRRDHTRKRKR